MRVEDETDVLDAFEDKVVLESSYHEVGAFQSPAVFEALHHLFPLCDLRANEQLECLQDLTGQAFSIRLMRVDELQI